MFMSKQHLVFGGLIAAAALTLLYAVEGYVSGIFGGAPSVSLRRMAGDYWYLALLVANCATGFVLAFFYPIFGRGLNGSRAVRGMKYGFGAWALATVLYPPLVYANIALPSWLILGWIGSGLINFLLIGYCLGLLVDIRE